MNKKMWSSFIFLYVFVFSVFAQNSLDKGLNSISISRAKSFVSFLASNALEGRGAGKHGGYVASEYLASYLMSIGIKPLFDDSYFQPFEAYNEDFQKKKRYTVDVDSILKYKQGTYRVLHLRNILGMIPGKDPNQYVVVGAHYDHLGMDEDLAGDKIYNGADDNASGVSAVMQIARAFVESGVKPERNVIFAFWDGEEHGVLGSDYFVSNCPFRDDLKGYLNFDMIGRNTDESKPNYVVYFYSDSNPAFSNWLKNDIQKYNLKLEPDYRATEKSLGGSDNRSFGKNGIPIIWFHTEGHPDYHKVSDTADKLNYNKLVDITKAAYLNGWNLANEKDY